MRFEDKFFYKKKRDQKRVINNQIDTNQKKIFLFVKLFT